MITNLPNHNEFLNIVIGCLSQSIYSVYKIHKESRSFLENTDLDIKAEEIWSHNYISLNTSFILLHQGLEALLKSEICKKSAFLLLELSPSLWPTLPEGKDKDFSDLYQIGGENLIKVFLAITIESKQRTPSFYNLIEKIRKTRNEIVHSQPKGRISVKDLLQYNLEIITVFLGKDKWLDILRDQFLANPINGHSEHDNVLFCRIISFLVDTVGKSAINKNLNININSRSYHCPNCYDSLQIVGYDTELYKFSYLYPNTATSNVLKCFICNNEHPVSRNKCDKGDCKGNVIANNIVNQRCLTCYK